jgi:hypothetical protein
MNAPLPNEPQLSTNNNLPKVKQTKSKDQTMNKIPAHEVYQPAKTRQRNVQTPIGLANEARATLAKINEVKDDERLLENIVTEKRSNSHLGQAYHLDNFPSETPDSNTFTPRSSSLTPEFEVK